MHKQSVPGSLSREPGYEANDCTCIHTCTSLVNVMSLCIYIHVQSHYLNLQFRDYSDDESEHHAKTKSRDKYVVIKQ